MAERKSQREFIKHQGPADNFSQQRTGGAQRRCCRYVRLVYKAHKAHNPLLPIHLTSHNTVVNKCQRNNLKNLNITSN